MKKILGLLAAFGLVAVSGSSVVACGQVSQSSISLSNDEEQSSNTSVAKEDLSNIIKDKKMTLGQESVYGSMPTVESIKNALNKKYLSLNVDDIDVSVIKETKSNNQFNALVVPLNKNSMYTGVVKINVIIKNEMIINRGSVDSLVKEVAKNVNSFTNLNDVKEMIYNHENIKEGKINEIFSELRSTRDPKTGIISIKFVLNDDYKWNLENNLGIFKITPKKVNFKTYIDGLKLTENMDWRRWDLFDKELDSDQAMNLIKLAVVLPEDFQDAWNDLSVIDICREVSSTGKVNIMFKVYNSNTNSHYWDGVIAFVEINNYLF